MGLLLLLLGVGRRCHFRTTSAASPGEGATLAPWGRSGLVTGMSHLLLLLLLLWPRMGALPVLLLLLLLAAPERPGGGAPLLLLLWRRRRLSAPQRLRRQAVARGD